MGASESSIARYQKDKEARARALLTKTFSTNSGQKIAPACDDGVALIDRDLPSFEYATTIEPKISQRLKELSSGNLVLHVPFESISQEAKDLQQFLLRVLRVDYGLRGLRNLSGLHLKFLNCAVQLRLFEAGHYSKSPTGKTTP
ncbi:hypothetical protein HII31_11783 [Pseudocercospora fuligena]|uniref:Uncharacterized protein n=1 Tax=Pseudocercospora fuligena TaxID=685502 RepID=A0A8H6VC42_9PEZI|nr:hypothetical protein HII31_11783 [Pseudocercospora fuligena]